MRINQLVKLLKQVNIDIDMFQLKYYADVEYPLTCTVNTSFKKIVFHFYNQDTGDTWSYVFSIGAKNSTKMENIAHVDISSVITYIFENEV